VADRPAATIARATATDAQLPKEIEELELTAEQRRAVLALRADLIRDVQPLLDAGRGFVRAVANGVERCNPKLPSIESEASWTDGVGETVRPPVLTAINRFHRILTRPQREKLVALLLDREQTSRTRNRDQDGARARSLGDVLDLSFSQTVTLLAQALELRDRFEQEIGPWRARYRRALEAFPRDDFDARREALAEAPLVPITTRLVRVAAKLFVPVLEPPQCQALGRFIHERVDDQGAAKK
jgi:hypothetical protein